MNKLMESERPKNMPEYIARFMPTLYVTKVALLCLMLKWLSSVKARTTLILANVSVKAEFASSAELLHFSSH